jgi:hypothetical protein
MGTMLLGPPPMSNLSQSVTSRHMSRSVFDQPHVTSVTHSYRSVTAVTVIRDGLNLLRMSGGIQGTGPTALRAACGGSF